MNGLAQTYLEFVSRGHCYVSPFNGWRPRGHGYVTNYRTCIGPALSLLVGGAAFMVSLPVVNAMVAHLANPKRFGLTQGTWESPCVGGVL